MPVLPNCLPVSITERGLRVATAPLGSPACVTLSGELDEFSAPVVARALAVHDAACRPLVIDVSGVTFLGAAGLRSLLATAPEPGGLHLWRPSPAVRRVVTVLGVEAVLDDEERVQTSAAGATPLAG